MTHGNQWRGFLEMWMCGALAARGGGGLRPTGPAPPPDGKIDKAIAQLDKLVDELMRSYRRAGHGGRCGAGRSEGLRERVRHAQVDTQSPVDADTVFQLASVSKSVGGTLVAQQVGLGRVQWDTRLRSVLPWFALSDARASDEVTIADMYSHRSGLPLHAGDRLEDMGYDRRQVLERLRYLPLDPFRDTYHYTNFGMTAGAEAMCVAVGVDWATLSETAIYQPLGMTRTSSRYADFLATAEPRSGPRASRTASGCRVRSCATRTRSRPQEAQARR